jgi:hypothetical protein
LSLNTAFLRRLGDLRPGKPIRPSGGRRDGKTGYS